MFKRRRKTNPIGPTCTQAYPRRAVTHTVNQYTQPNTTIGRSLEIQLGGAASRERWYEGLGLLCGAVP